LFLSKISNSGDIKLNFGTLFVVATPIGNLKDISPRAVSVLENVDLIASEDTRHSKKLLSKYNIKTRQIAYHEYNEEKVVDDLVAKLLRGVSIALISDAGTPLISDPGYRLISSAHSNGIIVSPIPGANAVISAISVSGLPTDRFCFEGYLPEKRNLRQAILKNLCNEKRTLIFLESVHRIEESIKDIAKIFGGDRAVFLGRELTKIYEQCIRTDLDSLFKMFKEELIPKKGEFILVVEGNRTNNSQNVNKLISLESIIKELLKYLPGSQIVDIIVKISNLRRNDIYNLMLSIRGKSGDS
tara:strand:- start:5035 stop:5934 length:900 start_codon:yes stop_codon:yes gene_type:complete